MMDSSSRSDSEEETSAPFSDYENPNYRKLYALLSSSAMMGSAETEDDSDEEKDDNTSETELTRDPDNETRLPEGWEKHEDDNGPYYWHIPSGTIQRQVPTSSLSKRDSLFYFYDDGLDKLREQVPLQSSISSPEIKGEVREEPSESATRPSQLSIEEYTGSPMESPYLKFPTPIEEPRKTIVARYLGKTPVSKPMGIDILNEAIERVIFDLDRAFPLLKNLVTSGEKTVRGTVALVHISPSTITVKSKADDKILVECRVRYLSFLGISKNAVENCGFILQVDENLFEAHCFECEPSSGALCKTLEAACKLRFQKCLDAHKQRTNHAISNQPAKVSNATSNPSTGLKSSQSMGAIKSTLVNAFSKLLYKR